MNSSTKMLLTLFLFSAATTVQAHLTGNHAMSIAEALRHLITEPSHWLVVIPVLAIVAFILIKKLAVSRHRTRL